MKSKFRKLTAWLLTSAMLFTLLPATAFAIPATHSHPICGAAHTDIGDHTGSCEDITWTAWDGTTDFPGGNVYLSADVTLKKNLEISSGTVNLCLNGKVLRISENAIIGAVIEVSEGATLNICDCRTTEHKFSPDESGLWVLNEESGTKSVYGGVITGGNTTVGSAIRSDGTLRIYGGNIVGNHATARAVVHSTGAEFSMYGGSICGNTGDDGNDGVGLCLWNRTGKQQIRGGKIYENTAAADDSPGGVGVYVSQGNLTISGAVEIYDNKRGIENDNIYVAWNRSSQNEYSLIIDGELTNTTPIGVWARYEDIIIKADGTNVTDLTEYMNNFTSDNTGRELQLSFDKTNIKLLSPHNHPICGAETCAADHNLDGTAENHQSVTWIAWDGTDMDEGEAGIQLNAGNYYLTKDVIVTSDTRGIHPVGNVALCLNGHTISCESGAAITATISFDETDDCLTLTDCAGTGLVTRPADDYSITIWISAGKLEQYGGTIQATSADIQSTAIWNQNNGTFSQYGGKIESESIGIHSLNESTVNLYGGTIEAAIADIYVRTEGAITLSSEISKPAEPYSIVADFNTPFTSGWNTYMSSATISDYFIPYSSEYIIKKNASTGELVFDVKPTTYTVKFDANGGSGTMENQTITLGEATALSENTFTKTGYFFEGWATTADGAKVYNDQQSVTDLADAGESITLFALWNKIPANAPAITSQPQGFEGANALTYGSIGADKKLSVETNADENEYTVTYQWYKNTTDSKDGAAAVGTEKDLAIENGLNAGDYYYYCKITVTRKDNGEGTSVDTDLVKVTVNKAAVAVPTAASKVYTGSTIKADISETADYTVTTNNGGITVGQYDVVLNLKDSANYKWSDGTETAAKTIKFEIKKATANAITGLAIEGWTFGESAKTPSASATFGTPAFAYVGTGETNYAENETPPANAGTYKVIAKVADTTNYAGASDEKTFTIAKATPSVSAPTAKTGLVYNGADKALVSAGTTSGGEMQYSLDGSTWATEIPQGNSAGSYTVYYKVVGGMNYNDNAGGTVQVAIAKAQIAKPSADSRTFTYTGSEQTYIVTENDKYTVSGNKRTNAGTQNVTVALKDKNNYEWADRTTDDLTFTFNIGRADAEITINGDTSIVKTYGDIWELPTASSTFGTVRTNKTVENLKNAGTYTVTYSVIETENYNRDTKTVSVTVNPLPVNITWENTESLVYDGNEKTINPVVANKVSGDTFNFAFDGTSTLTATEKGTYTATVTDVGNANYTLTGGTNLTKTWAIAEAANEWTTPLSITGWIYGGTANEPTAAAKFGTPVYTYANSIDGAYTSDVPASAGTWYVKATVAGATSYAEISDTKEFVITEKELNADSITAIGDVTFTGEEIKPAVEVRDGNTILVLGTDYEVAYQDNANAGTAKVIITFKGNYKGTPEKSFIILPKKINPTITLAAPASNETPVTSIETEEYTATVVWSPTVTDKFAYSTEYTATVTITPKANYTVTGITENEYTIEGATVTNAADSGNITAVFAKTGSRPSSGGGVSKYTVKFETNGGTTVANKSVTRNALLAEPTAPTKDGYTFDGWYTDKELATAYDFDTKVTKSFTLYAKWTEIEKEPEDTDVHNCPSIEFTDLDVTAWYHLDTDYVIENGIFKGVTEKIFAPNDKLTRAMLVTVLYRVEGEPATNRSIPFADIDMGSYYANAVVWAQQNGIVKGVSETEFAPDDNITREQIAAIMHRYAQYKGYDVSVGENTNILSYDDFDSISEYAIPSMQYAVGSGLMKGKTTSTLNPLDNATRAEIAAILHRFIEANK